MKEIGSRKYKRIQIKPKRLFKTNINIKRGRRRNSRLDRRGMR